MKNRNLKECEKWMQKYERNILQTGTLLGVSFPKSWSDFYKLKPHDKVELITGDAKITISLLGGGHGSK